MCDKYRALFRSFGACCCHLVPTACAVGYSSSAASRLEGRVRMAYLRKRPAAWTIHPGQILREEFLKPLHMSVYALAKGLRVPAQGINDVVLEKRGISPATALRLAQFFGTTAEFWMNMQAAYELATVRRSLKKDVRRIRPVRVA